MIKRATSKIVLTALFGVALFYFTNCSRSFGLNDFFDIHTEVNFKELGIGQELFAYKTRYYGRFWHKSKWIDVFRDVITNYVMYYDVDNKTVMKVFKLVDVENQGRIHLHVINPDSLLVTSELNRTINLTNDKEVLKSLSFSDIGIKENFLNLTDQFYVKIGDRRFAILEVLYGIENVYSDSIYEYTSVFYEVIDSDSGFTFIDKEITPMYSRFRGRDSTVYESSPKLALNCENGFAFYHSTGHKVKSININTKDEIETHDFEVTGSRHDIRPIPRKLNIDINTLWLEVYNKVIIYNLAYSCSNNLILRLIRPRNADFKSGEPEYRFIEVINEDYQVIDDFKVDNGFGNFEIIDGVTYLRFADEKENVLRYYTFK